MSNVEYQYRIYTSDGSTIAYTFGSSQLASVPQNVGAQVIRFTEGRTETVPWTVDAVDLSSGVTNALADSSGRMTLLSRLADFRRRIDSTETTGWETLGVARIADIPLNQDVASYQFLNEDERMIERGSQIWTGGKTDVFLLPPARVDNYGRFPGQRISAFGLNIWIQQDPYYYRVRFPFTYENMPQDVVDAITGDVEIHTPYVTSLTSTGGVTGSTVGNFNNLRMRIVQIVASTGYPFTGTPVLTNVTADFEVLTFIGAPTINLAVGLLFSNLPHDPVQPFRDRLAQPVELAIPLAAPGTSMLSAVGNGWLTGFAYFPDAPAAQGNPYFIGSSDGEHLADTLSDIYDGTYGGQAVRYSTAAMDDLRADRSLPLLRWIITEPANMAEWTQEHIYRPFNIVPFVDAEGRVAPKSVRLPNPQTISTGSLFEFSASNLVEHPTWLHTTRDIITVLRFHYISEQSLHRGPVAMINEGAAWFRLQDDKRNIYGIVRSDQVIEKRHDRVAQFGERVLDIRLDGIHDAETAERQANLIAREFFDRFGDGSIQGTLTALSTGETVEGGDFATVTLDTFPNPQQQGRGGTRIVQIMSRSYLPGRGVECEWLDAGPNLGVLTTPTVSLAVSTSDPYHAIIATVGTVPTGGSLLVQLAESTANSAPSTDSELWRTILSTVSSSGTYALTQVNSGSYQWGRVRAAAPNRIRSAWGYSSAYATMTALAGPTNFLTSGVTQGTANLSWVNATDNPDVPVELLLNEAAALDTFADTSGTALSAHTPDVGFNAWYHNASTMVLVIGSNRAAPSTAAVISSGLVLSSANIANDYFSIQATIDLVDNATTNTPQGGVVFRASSSTGSTSLEYLALVLTPNAGLNEVKLRTIEGGSVLTNVGVVSFTTTETSYNIGVVVSSQSITPFTQPVSATGALTYHESVTSTYYNDTGHQRMGLYVNTTFTANQPVMDTLVASQTTDIGERVAILPEGSTSFHLFGLSTGRGYLASVRHVDPFPMAGFSASTSLTFVPTTSAAATPPALAQFGIFLGTTST